jgi:hypothetical protein
MQHRTSKDSFNKATVLDPLSESDAPPTKKLNKGKERSEQPASVPEPRRTSRTLPSRAVATDATRSAGTSSRPVAPILMAVDDGVILGMDQGLKLMLEMMERQEVAFGERFERLEQRMERVASMMEMLYGLVGVNFNDEVERRALEIARDGTGPLRPPSVPCSSPAPADDD